MRVLITGNMGYVGTELAKYLVNSDPTIELFGYDTGFYGHSLTGCGFLPETRFKHQIFGDLRDVTNKITDGIDAIVHLAAVSNDPIGNEFEQVTNDINKRASVNLAKMAAKSGVKNFVFASSCSMYGETEGGPRKETDPTNPLTAYARSKIGVEEELKDMDLENMVFTSLRFATACGMSDRLRLDLVLNDFVACAVTTGEITVLSDGSPWRPLIDVEDMSRSIHWAINRQKDNGGAFLAINAGSDENNYQVRGLAETVAKQIDGTIVRINKDALPDNRSYKVDFSLYKNLAPNHLPKVSLEESIIRLKDGFERMKFNDKNFRETYFMRLNTLRQHIANGMLDKNLRWLR